MKRNFGLKAKQPPSKALRLKRQPKKWLAKLMRQERQQQRNREDRT